MRRNNLERLYWMAQRYQKAGRTGMVVGVEQILELFQRIEILEQKLKRVQNRCHQEARPPIVHEHCPDEGASMDYIEWVCERERPGWPEDPPTEDWVDDIPQV